ncbi:MAG: PDGLE domain-containing protein [Oligoflexia bacterium]|nr:PDGLE domain-containing protein [Oligoflexia bacterium]
MFKYRSTVIFILLSLVLAVFISPFASSSPDGLEWVAEIKGFLSSGEEIIYWTHSLMPDYRIAFISGEGLSTSVAGFLGTIICFIASLLFFRIFLRKRKKLQSD